MAHDQALPVSQTQELLGRPAASIQCHDSQPGGTQLAQTADQLQVFFGVLFQICSGIDQQDIGRDQAEFGIKRNERIVGEVIRRLADRCVLRIDGDGGKHDRCRKPPRRQDSHHGPCGQHFSPYSRLHVSIAATVDQTPLTHLQK